MVHRVPRERHLARPRNQHKKKHKNATKDLQISRNRKPKIRLQGKKDGTKKASIRQIETWQQEEVDGIRMK